jgi:hypothetical protein
MSRRPNNRAGNLRRTQMAVSLNLLMEKGQIGSLVIP